jgi:anti-sigma regulatory factor (Ser/Thr protein kinase)
MGATSRNGLVRSFAVEFSDASCLPGLRSRLRQLIPAGDGRIDAELVCTELVTNAVEHAAGPRTVRIVLDAADLRIEVEDGSPDEPLIPGVSRFGAFRGRGLALVEALARWGIIRRAAGKTVWATLAVA